MMDPFQDPNSWAGGTFDALMYFRDASVSQALKIAERLWAYEKLDGPFRQRHIPTANQAKVSPVYTEDGCEQLVGKYRHADGQVSPFVHTTIRDEFGLWVYAGIPMGGFPENWNVGAYPFDDGKPLDWTLRFADELRVLSAYVREQLPMVAAAYGWFGASIVDEIDDALNGHIQENRWHLIEAQTAAGWHVYPVTKVEPLFS